MNSFRNTEMGAVCSAGPLAGGFQVQSSQPHLKRFIMFDHSGGKGRVFFHPALAEELFGPAEEAHGYVIQGFTPGQILASNQISSLNTEQSNIKVLKYKQMVEGAFSSLQRLRSSRQSDMACLQEQQRVLDTCTSSQKPVEAIAVKDDFLACGVQTAVEPCMAPNSLVCEEKLKLSACLPSTQVAAPCGFPISSSRQNRGSEPATSASGLSHEITEDLDALLSSDEEDDDVRSTGHSPEESLGKEKRDGGKDCEEEVEQDPSKRRKVVEKPHERVLGACAGDVVTGKPSLLCLKLGYPSNRRQKIKRTVEALRRMLPGGALLDTNLVLDEAIRYVRSLRDRVNQLEASRLQSQK